MAFAEESSEGGDGDEPRGGVGVVEPDPWFEDRALVLTSDTEISSLAPSIKLNADRVNGGVDFGVPKKQYFSTSS